LSTQFLCDSIDQSKIFLHQLGLRFMNNFITEVRETLIPSKNARDGPLPPLLIGMTLITGLVDAFSYLVLGHVFVANMTGNVVFLAFALAGAHGFSIVSSLLGLAFFFCR
jgi:hypothetical protein